MGSGGFVGEPGSTYSPGTSSTASARRLAADGAAPHHGAERADDDGDDDHEQAEPTCRSHTRRLPSAVRVLPRDPATPSQGEGGQASPGRVGIGSTDRSSEEAPPVRRRCHRADDAELVDDELGPGVLRRATARALVGDDAPVEQQLATPDAPRLLAVLGLPEAGGGEGALAADRLGPGDVDDVVGEEQRGQGPVAVGAAGQAGTDGGGTPLGWMGGGRWRTWCSCPRCRRVRRCLSDRPRKPERPPGEPGGLRWISRHVVYVEDLPRCRAERLAVKPWVSVVPHTHE